MLNEDAVGFLVSPGLPFYLLPPCVASLGWLFITDYIQAYGRSLSVHEVFHVPHYREVLNDFSEPAQTRTDGV